MLRTIVDALKALLGRTSGASNEQSTEITGVVSALGGGASKGPAGTPWVGSYELIAWREGSKPIILQKLRIEQFLGYEDDAHKAWADQPQPRATVRLEVVLPEAATGHRPTARLIRYLGVVDDPELEAATQAMLNPPDFVDPVLGRFKADDMLVDMFETRHEWQGNAIELTLIGENPTELEAAAKVARLLVENQSAWQKRAEESIAEDLYELWLDVWRGEKAKLSEAEFVAATRLTGISIERDGTFTFWFDDGDLFWGHTISAGGNPDTGFEGASISG